MLCEINLLRGLGSSCFLMGTGICPQRIHFAGWTQVWGTLLLKGGWYSDSLDAAEFPKGFSSVCSSRATWDNSCWSVSSSTVRILRLLIFASLATFLIFRLFPSPHHRDWYPRHLFWATSLIPLPLRSCSPGSLSRKGCDDKMFKKYSRLKIASWDIFCLRYQDAALPV